MRGFIVVAFVVVAVVLTGCDVDVGTLWANYDWCGYRTNPDTTLWACQIWWGLGNGDITEQQFTDEVNARYNATSTAQAQPTETPTRIPTPVYKPINVETATPVVRNSPLPTPTPTYGPYSIPNVDDYNGLLDWYFNQGE